jgi:hypothetical protein
MSHHLQEVLCMLGQSVVYSEASEICNELLHIDISSTQIQRVCRFYGDLVDSVIEKDLQEHIPKLENVDKSDNVYVMVDGSMLLTRPKDWKEIKLGRLFKQSKIVPINTK